MWAALPLLGMEGVSVDTSEIDSISDDVWLQKAQGFARRFLYREQDADRLLYPARFMVVLLGVGLGVLIFLWAREWLGFVPATLALAFFAIEPNLAAHSRLVTTDLASAFFIFSTVYCLWRSCREPSSANIAGLVISCSLAFVTKYSAVLLIPIIMLLFATAMTCRMRIGARSAALISVVLIASTFFAIWSVYGFRYAPSDSDGWLLRLQETQTVQSQSPRLGDVVSRIDSWQILPNAYTQGFLMSQASARQTAYLAGEYSTTGWWYYFPAVFLMKTPTALTVLLLAGTVLLGVLRRQFGIANELFVVIPVLVYMGFAIASGINIGLRHILPIYPFLLLIAAAAARTMMAWRRPIGRVALAMVVAYWGARYANTYPHMLTYFSVFLGGPANGMAYVADSNLDWGQDLKLLKEWMRSRNVEHVNLAYFGTADPDYYGIHCTPLPGTAVDGMVERPKLPGYVAISATLLAGVYLEEAWRLFYSPFLRMPPADRIGNSIYVYWIDRWPDATPQSGRAGSLVRNSAVQTTLADWLFFELQWTDRAITHYRKALEHNSDDPAVLDKLGLALLTAEKAEEAVVMLGRAAALKPADADTQYRLALALLKAGKAKEAANRAESVVLLKPDDSAAHDLLGVALAMNGRPDAAASSFAKALELDPANADAREHLRRLRDSSLE